jgi:cytochrome c551/c552
MKNKGSGVVLVIAIVILVVVVAGFLILFASSQTSTTEGELNATEINQRADQLLSMGNAENGALLITTKACAACHVEGAANGIAPSFEGIADVAGMQVEGLTAAGYLYESIVNPGQHLVEGFANSMPQNYGQQLSEQDLADLLAFLAQQTG